MQKVCRRYAVQKPYSTLLLGTPATKPILNQYKTAKTYRTKWSDTLNTFVGTKRNSPDPLFFLAAKIWIFVFQDVSFFCPTVATIAAHNATSVLNQNNHTTFHKFTRYVLVTRVTLLLYNYGFAALYQKKPTRVWKSLEEFGSFFFSRESSSSSFYIFAKFVVNLSSFVAIVR